MAKEKMADAVQARKERINKHVAALTTYLTTGDTKTIQKVKNGEMTMDEYEMKVYSYLVDTLTIPENEIEETMSIFEKNVFGYGIITDLIEDKDISDIKILRPGPGGIRIVTNGIRKSSHIYFEDVEELRVFFDTVATKNSKGTSRTQASTAFTDKKTSKNFILRVTLTTDYIVADENEHPYITIRKIPKFKRKPEEFINAGYMTKAQYDFLAEEVRKGTSINIFGRGGTWKTSLLNTLIEEIDDQDAIKIIQEHQELFTLNHPETMNVHVITDSGDGRIKYDLCDLGTSGLLQDIDTFINGEIKGPEALDYIEIRNSGTRTMSTLHAGSILQGVERMCLLAKRVTTLQRTDILRQMIDLGICVAVEKKGSQRKVSEIGRVKGFDSKEEQLIIEYVEV